MHPLKLASAITLALCVAIPGCDDGTTDRPATSQPGSGGKADETQNGGAGAITTQVCEDLEACWEDDDLSRCAVSIWEGEPQASEAYLVDTCCEDLDYGYCFDDTQPDEGEDLEDEGDDGDDGEVISCEQFDTEFFTCLESTDEAQTCVDWADALEDGEVVEDCCNSGDPLDVCEYLASHIPTTSCAQIESDFNRCMDELSASYCEGDFRVAYPDGGACCVGEFEYDHCYIYEA